MDVSEGRLTGENKGLKGNKIPMKAKLVPMAEEQREYSLVSVELIKPEFQQNCIDAAKVFIPFPRSWMKG